MAGLTKEQIDFLNSQRVPLSRVFDASGMRKKDWAVAMKAEGYDFAFGTTPCGRAGHTLRTRAGHCIQCDTEVIAHQMRHSVPGYVYIAGSPNTGLIKVGATGDLHVRTWQLGNWRYGGAPDWEMLVTSHVQNVGKVEFSAQAALKARAVEGSYYREGRTQRCYELFRCSYDEARQALVDALPLGWAIKEHGPDRARKLWQSR